MLSAVSRWDAQFEPTSRKNGSESIQKQSQKHGDFPRSIERGLIEACRRRSALPHPFHLSAFD